MKRLYYLILLLSLFTNLSLFAQNQGFTCGVKDNQLSPETIKAMQMAPAWLAEKQGRKAATEMNVCRLGIDIDYDTYVFFNKDTTFIKYELLKMIEKLSKIYEAEINTQLVITYINILKDENTNPYKGKSDIFELLNILYNNWAKAPFNGLPVDKVMYLPTKSFTGAGGVATGRVNVSPWGNINTMAHELGHNFGSPHTQSCSWPGGPLDFCYPVEEDCYQNSLESTAGTIMSYCNTVRTFHPLCRALMQNHSQAYHQKVNRIPSSPILTDNLNLNGEPRIIFNADEQAESFLYEVSETPDFSQNVHTDTSQIRSIYYPYFKKNKSYYVRVKSRNRFGQSGWSKVIRIDVPGAVLTAPVLKRPYNLSANSPETDFDKELTLPFDHVEGATAYELDLYSTGDRHEFIYGQDYRYYYSFSEYPVTVTTDNKFLINPQKVNIFTALVWRVRALQDGKKGPWSETQSFTLSNTNPHLYSYLFDRNNMPLSFPVNFYNYEGSFDQDLKFTVSAKEDYSKPVFEKTVKATGFSRNITSLIIDKLLPSTNYFSKMEVINPKPDLIFGTSQGVVRTSKLNFRTAAKDIPQNWKFFNQYNVPQMGGYFTNYIMGNNASFSVSELGISKMDIKDMKATLYNLKNTDYMLSNKQVTMDVDSYGNFWSIIEVSKRNGGFDGVFPLPVYALRKFDGQTMQLLYSEEFVTDKANAGITYFDADGKLVCHSRNTIARIENGKLVPIMKFSDLTIWDIVSADNYAYIMATNLDNDKTEIWQCNLITKEKVQISQESYYGAMQLDRNRNIYAMTDKGIQKINGTQTTFYGLNNSSIKPQHRYNSISIDNFNNVYAISNNNNDGWEPTDIHKFNGKEWKLIGSSPVGMGLNSVMMQVDKFGKLWFANNSTDLIRFDPCQTIAKPRIIGNATNTTLEATGCTSVVWNWKNNDETVYEKLVSGSNKIEVSPNSTNTYYARCYDNGCSGEDDSFVLSAYNLLTDKVRKNQVCQGDSVVIFPKLEGVFGDKNQLSAVLESSKNKFSIPLVRNNDGYLFRTDETIPGGKYWLKITTTLPVLVSRDSIAIDVLSLPIVNILGKDNICPGQSINLSATGRNGIAPYTYHWEINNAPSPRNDSIMTNIDKPGNIDVKAIDSKGCVSNEATLNVTKSNFDNLKISASGSTDLVNNASVVLSVPSVMSYAYEWYKDKQPIQGATTSSHTTSQAGSYYVKASEKGCSGESNLITVSLITASEPKQSDELNLKVFPNPSDGNFTFEIILEDNTPLELSVFDMAGKTIWQKHIKGVGKHTEQLNLSEHASGTYLLTGQKDNWKQTVKLEKQ